MANVMRIERGDKVTTIYTHELNGNKRQKFFVGSKKHMEGLSLHMALRNEMIERFMGKFGIGKAEKHEKDHIAYALDNGATLDFIFQVTRNYGLLGHRDYLFAYHTSRLLKGTAGYLNAEELNSFIKKSMSERGEVVFPSSYREIEKRIMDDPGLSEKIGMRKFLQQQIEQFLASRLGEDGMDESRFHALVKRFVIYEQDINVGPELVEDLLIFIDRRISTLADVEGLLPEGEYWQRKDCIRQKEFLKKIEEELFELLPTEERKEAKEEAKKGKKVSSINREEQESEPHLLGEAIPRRTITEIAKSRATLESIVRVIEAFFSSGQFFMKGLNGNMLMRRAGYKDTEITKREIEAGIKFLAKNGIIYTEGARSAKKYYLNLKINGEEKWVAELKEHIKNCIRKEEGNGAS